MTSDTLNEIKTLFGLNRIKSLLIYKSKVLNNGFYDGILYLLLDQFEPLDIEKLRSLAVSLNFRFEIKHQYLNDIESYDKTGFKVIKYNSFDQAIFANADILLGKNYFRDFLDEVNNSEIKESLLEEINDCFRDLDTCILKTSNTTKSHINLKKSFAKVIAHILFLKEGYPSIYVYYYDYDELIEEALTKNYFSQSTRTRLKDIFFHDVSLPILLSETKRFLYLDFININSSVVVY